MDGFTIKPNDFIQGVINPPDLKKNPTLQKVLKQLKGGKVKVAQADGRCGYCIFMRRPDGDDGDCICYRPGTPTFRKPVQTTFSCAGFLPAGY